MHLDLTCRYIKIWKTVLLHLGELSNYLLPLVVLAVIPLAVIVTSLGIVSGTMVAGDVGVAAVTGEAESPAGPTAGMGDTEDAAVVNEGPEGFSSVGLASRDPTLK